MPNPRVFSQLSQRLALLAMLVGGLVMLGWIFEQPWLTQLRPDWVSVKFNSAIGFMLAGWALFIRHRDQQISVGYRVAAVSLLLLGALTFSQYALSINLGIDQWLVRDPLAVDRMTAGRMSLTCALCFLLLGSILLLDGSRFPQRQRLMGGLTLIIALISGLVLLGYAYGANPLSTIFIDDLSPMALHTALVFLLLTIPALSLHTEHPLLSAATLPHAKNFFLIILIIPVASWLRLEGQYRFELYDTPTGVALLTLFFIVLWLFVVVRTMNTIQKQQLEIQTQHRLNQSILSNMSEGLVVVDAQYTYQVFNPAAEAIMGVHNTNPDPTTWQAAYGIFHPDSMQPYQVEQYPLTQALHGTAVNDVVLFVRNAHHTEGVYVNVNARPIHDESAAIVGAVAVLSDISEKRRLSEAQLQAAHYERSLSEALILFSTATERASLLDTLLQQLGSTHAFAALAFYGYFPEQQQYKLAAHYASVSAIDPQVSFEEQQLTRLLTLQEAGVLVKQGLAELCPVLGLLEQPAALLLCPVNYYHQKLGLLLLTANHSLSSIDLQFSQRLATQLAVAFNNIHQEELNVLSSELSHYSIEISIKNEMLENESKMKSEFLANMSHELRTPLNAIIGFSEILKDGMVGDLSSDQSSYVTEIFDSGEHLLSLINDILDLSKVEAGMMTLDLARVEVVNLLQGSLSVIKEKALKNSISLTLDVADAPAHILADGRKVKQIIYNLLSNAVKFTPEHGEIKLVARQVSREACQLCLPHLSVYQLPAPDNDWQQFLEIRVHDTGIGIDTADLHRLFQPFTQIDSSLSRKFAGTGLGLELIRRMAELHGGSVAVASALMQGSCFAVWLPIREVEFSKELAESMPEPTEITPIPNAGNLLALVVENSQQATDILRLYLEEEGFSVITAPSATQALAIMAKSRPDLITLDLLLPGMDGWDVLNLIKADPQLVDIPVVVISGISNSASALPPGAAKVLQKPLRREELVATLQELGMTNHESGPFTVLAADDDSSALTLINSCLASEKNISLLYAHNGLEAVSLIQQKRPDLLVVDLLMPVMNGFEVVARLKEAPETASLPIVVVSSKEITAEERQWLNEQNVVQIMTKTPFDRSAFLTEVRRTLKGNRKCP
ncbi:MAG: response regulator [Moraxellaceae bacterium]